MQSKSIIIIVHEVGEVTGLPYSEPYDYVEMSDEFLAVKAVGASTSGAELTQNFVG
jgi:hypothetical protein